MEIDFDTPFLLKVCNSDRAARKAFGADGAKKLRRRLDDLNAAATLAAMALLPGRCHELAGNLSGHLALALDGGRRLIIRPNNVPLPLKEDGGIDWAQVTRVAVTNIEDYHV